MPRLREETRTSRRQQFIDAAWRCAASHGYRDTTIDAVCAETGFTKGAFYAHFASKQALLEALIEDDAAEVDRVMADLEHKGVPPRDRVRRLTRALVERDSDTAHAQVRADLWAAILTEPEIRVRVNQTMQHQRAILRAWIDSAVADGAMQPVPANALASILLALSDGLMLHRALNPAAFRWANVAIALDALVSGIPPS